MGTGNSMQRDFSGQNYLASIGQIGSYGNPYSSAYGYSDDISQMFGGMSNMGSYGMHGNPYSQGQGSSQTGVDQLSQMFGGLAMAMPPTPPDSVIYQYVCQGCGATYIGQTSRPGKNKIKELG